MSSPRISAMWRATGRTSARTPSRTAAPTCSGIEASSSAAVTARASIWLRERSSAASITAGSGRPAAASAMRCFARSRAWVSTAARLLCRAGWTRPASSTTFRPSSSPRCPSNRATRRDCSSIAARSGRIEHRAFRELPDVLHGELVVVNDTRVVPARLRLRRESGGAAEVLLLEPVDGNGTWEALVRPSRRLRVGEELGPVRLQRSLGEGRWDVALRGTPDGDMPLPPYIHEPLADPARYQTVYGDVEGSAAAPTAGLHFTPELLARARSGSRDPSRRARHLPSGCGRHARGPRAAR